MASGELAVFDLDGTLTRHDTLGPYLAGLLLRRPWRLPRLLLVLPAVLLFAVRRDRGALKGSLLHAALGGLPREVLERWTERYVPRLLRDGLFADALVAVNAHRAHADRLLLMSASTDLYVPRIAAALGFDECICTRVRWREDGRLDGRLASSNCRGEEKRRCLAAVIARDAPGLVSAYGNADSDLPHMRLARRAVLVNGSARTGEREASWLTSLRWR